MHNICAIYYTIASASNISCNLFLKKTHDVITLNTLGNSAIVFNSSVLSTLIPRALVQGSKIVCNNEFLGQ